MTDSAVLATREHWRTRGGFILASIGSAVGLGNIWRFAYVAGENGGGAFLIVYLLVVAAIGVPLVMAELAIGKRGASDAVAAFAALAPGAPWRYLGWLGFAGAALILSYYSVIAGWALRYFAISVSGNLWTGQTDGFDSHFQSFIADGVSPVGWHLAMIALTMVVVAGGVARGIERANMVLMPLLALTVVALAAYALSLPGSAKGVAFLFAPDWSAFGDSRMILAALGQAFFSIGVGMAVFVTYGGYMRREYGIPSAAITIAAGDTLFAVVAGLAIFPAVFAFGGDPAAGPALAFVTLPRVFLEMPAGAIVAPAFFLLLSAAALTSMVSLLQVPTAIAMRRWRLRRSTAVLSLGGAIAFVGIPWALSYGPFAGIAIAGVPLLDAIDYAVSNVLLPLSALGLAVFLGWVIAPAQASMLAEVGDARWAAVFVWLLRLIPVCILVLMIVQLSG